MIDYSTIPYVKIGTGKDATYKFRGNPNTYSEKEFKAMIKESLKNGTNTTEVVKKTKSTSTGDIETESTTD